MGSRRLQWLLLAAWATARGAGSDVCVGEDEGDDSCALSLSLHAQRRKAAGGLVEAPSVAATRAPPLRAGTASCGSEQPAFATFGCIFPFTLDGVEYTNCTSYGYPGKQWCATEVDSTGRATMGMLCAADCPQDRRTPLEVCTAASMEPRGRCGSDHVNACLTNACPARCAKYNTFPYPGAEPAYSAFTAFPAMNDAIYRKQWKAVETLGAFAPGFNRTPEIFDVLHSTLDYICCQNTTTTIAYMHALKTFEFSWREIGPITWDRMGCSLDNITDPSIIYLEAFVDLATNVRLLNFTGRLQQHMRNKGFEVANPRAMPFHFVISMVPLEADGIRFNTADALRALSKLDFGTIHLCEFTFFGLPDLGMTNETNYTFGGEVLFAKDHFDCPDATDALGRETRLTWRGVEIAVKVDLAR